MNQPTEEVKIALQGVITRLTEINSQEPWHVRGKITKLITNLQEYIK